MSKAVPWVEELKKPVDLACFLGVFSSIFSTFLYFYHLNDDKGNAQSSFQAGVTHNNIGVGAVFVAKDGGWRLGELQHACPFSAATAEFLDACRAYRDQAALSPEETVSVTEFLDAWRAYRDQAALSPEETVSVTELLDAWRAYRDHFGKCYRTP